MKSRSKFLREYRFKPDEDVQKMGDDFSDVHKYEERARKGFPFFQKIGERTKHFAICPHCGNPIECVGLYIRTDKNAPYWIHFRADVHGIAKFDPKAYEECPYHEKQ